MASNSAYLRQTLTGIEGISEVLNALPSDLRKQIMSTAMGEAAKPIVRAAKTFAPRKTGALRTSINHVVRKYRDGESVVAIIGPDKDYYGSGKRLKKTADRRGADRPSKYAHLVEFGHAVKGGVGAKLVQPKPFMRPAVMSAASSTGETLAEGVRKGIERTRARLVKKGLHVA
jgi:HK97 gp10 family phage protein